MDFRTVIWPVRDRPRLRSTEGPASFQPPSTRGSEALGRFALPVSGTGGDALPSPRGPIGFYSAPHTDLFIERWLRRTIVASVRVGTMFVTISV